MHSHMSTGHWQAPSGQGVLVSRPLVAVASRFLLEGRDHWESADAKGLDANTLFAVAPGAPEFSDVASLFLATCPHRSVDKLERVENGRLHEVFKLTQNNVQKQCARYGAGIRGTPVTRRLFHGTKVRTPIQAPMLLVNWPVM